MDAHSENNEFKQQEWDMEFKDPFSLEEDELTTCCSDTRSQPAVVTTSYISGSHLAVETLSDGLVQSTVAKSSLQTVPHEHKTATTGMELPNWKEKSQHHQSDITAADTCLSTAVSVHGSKRIHHVNESVASYGKKSSHDTNVELNSSEVTLASSEEQSPIPVMLSSAKRFCASDDIENSRAAKWCSAYKLPSPSAVVSKSPVRFPQPAYPPTAYNIPAWPTASLPLPLNNSSVTALAVPPVVPYNNCIPYSGILPHSSNIPVLYNESSIPVVDGIGAPHWPGARLHLQNILTKPPPPLPDVSHVVALGLPSSNFPGLQTGPVPHLQNGLTAHRLPLSTVPKVIPPYPPPNINRLPFITSTHSVLLPQQCWPHNAVPHRDKSGLLAVSSTSVSTGQCLSSCDSVVAQQPKSSSSNADVSVFVSSSALLKHNNINNTEHNNNKHLMPNDKTEQLRPTLPVADKLSTVASTGIFNSCPSLTSSEFSSKQTVTPAASLSSTSPPEVKFSSTFAQLDPRIHNGHRQSSSTSAQLQSSANAASTHSSAFVVPVPPPLPSLEELTADTSEDLQKEDKVPVFGLTSPSAASDTMTTDSPQLDRVLVDRTQAAEEQVRAILKPFFKSGMIDKHAYKEIMRKAVPKICASRSADISTTRVQSFIDAYVAKVTNADKRKSGGSSSSGSNAT